MEKGVRFFIEAWDRSERPARPGGKQMYQVFYDGEVLIESTWEPCFDSCRALLAKGITGKAEMWAHGEPHARMYVDIEKGAKLTVSENDRDGPRIVKYRPRPDRLSEFDGRHTERPKARPKGQGARREKVPSS